MNSEIREQTIQITNPQRKPVQARNQIGIFLESGSVANIPRICSKI
jgi:hypothetical protein